jgi:hypothetical protein
MSRESIKVRRKSELKAASKKYRKALYKELNTSSIRIVEFGKNMAVLGGGLYVGYTILDRFLDSQLKTEKKKEDAGKFESLNKIILPLLALALQQGSMILLKKARIMLIDYLEEKNKADV